MFGTKFCTARRRFEVVLLALMLALVLTGCGGSDEEEQAVAEQRHSMVPANLDTLLVETGSDLPENQNLGEAELVTETAPPGSNGDSPTGEITIPPQVVEVETPAATPTQANTATATQAGKTGTHSLQVGSFGLMHNALSLAAKVKDQGYPATVEQALVHGKTYHRVFVRGLDSRTAAENLGEELRASLGISYLVLRQP